MAEPAPGCARATGSVVGERPADEAPQRLDEERKGETMSAMVGRKAPDFEAPAYHQGSFTNVKLSDHLGKWILLCFYPGDFTFV